MRISKLDGLRGFFSVMIFLYHYNKNFLPWYFDNFFIGNSDIFVDFFFVLSGFVISYNYKNLKNLADFKIYIKNRFLRIYPLHIYTSLIVFCYVIISQVFIIEYYPRHFEGNGFNFRQHIEPLIDGVLLTNSTFLFGSTNGINGPSWSISSEIISYVVFGILFIYLPKLLKEISFFILIISSSFFLFFQGGLLSTGDFGFLRGFISFFLGYFVFRFYNESPKIRIGNKIEWLLPIILVFIMLLIDFLKSNFNENLNFILFSIPLFFSISIYILLNTNGIVTKYLESRPLQFLGKLSFSIYLNHSIILTLMLKSSFRLFSFQKNDINELFVFFIVLSILITYSIITNKFIELKLTQWLKKNCN